MGNIKNDTQIKWGAVISYCMIILNALFGLFVTPFILKHLGSSVYGVYKTMSSLSASLLILDLGIGGTLMRYIAKYRSSSEDKKIGSFVSMMLCECLIIVPIIALVELVLYFRLDGMYAASFSTQELYLAKQIFVILSINIILNIFENFLFGIISGYNRFVVSNGVKLISLFLKIVCTLVLLPIINSAIMLVSLNLVLAVLTIIIQLLYIAKKFPIPLNFRFKEWETGVFKESFIYTFLIFLTTIVAQVNNNLDNILIGAALGPDKVTVYSFGLLIFGMFEQLSTAISGVALPTISKIILEEDWKQKVQAFIVKLGRVQFMLLGAAVVGFSLIGKDFIQLWLDKGFEDVYWIVLILMIPSLFELCVNVCLSILRAKNMLGFRTFVITGATVLNAIITIVGLPRYGYVAAAVGTAFSFIIGCLVVMNIYYYKKLSLPMLRIYREIMKGTWLCLLLAGGAMFFVSQFTPKSWIGFLLNVATFAVAYAITMLLFGFNQKEKQAIPVLNKIWK